MTYRLGYLLRAAIDYRRQAVPFRRRRHYSPSPGARAMPAPPRHYIYLMRHTYYGRRQDVVNTFHFLLSTADFVSPSGQALAFRH